LKAATKVPYDALDMLRSDHMKAETVLIELRLSKNAEKRRRLFQLANRMLERHMRLEEEIFYPACASIDELKPLIDHSRTDHQLVKNVLQDLAVINPSTERYTQLVTTLIKELERHVATEENVVFTKVKKHMSRVDLDRLRQRMLEARDSKGRSLR